MLLQLLGVSLLEAPIHLLLEELVLGSEQPLVELGLAEHWEAQAAFGSLLGLTFSPFGRTISLRLALFVRTTLLVVVMWYHLAISRPF